MKFKSGKLDKTLDFREICTDSGCGLLVCLPGEMFGQRAQDTGERVLNLGDLICHLKAEEL